MPIRHFCDLCGDEIKAGEPFYGVATTVRRNADENPINWNGGRVRLPNREAGVQLRAEWTDAEVTHNMTCVKCVALVLETIERIRNGK